MERLNSRKAAPAEHPAVMSVPASHAGPRSGAAFSLRGRGMGRQAGKVSKRIRDSHRIGARAISRGPIIMYSFGEHCQRSQNSAQGNETMKWTSAFPSEIRQVPRIAASLSE